MILGGFYGATHVPLHEQVARRARNHLVLKQQLVSPRLNEIDCVYLGKRLKAIHVVFCLSTTHFLSHLTLHGHVYAKVRFVTVVNLWTPTPMGNTVHVELDSPIYGELMNPSRLLVLISPRSSVLRSLSESGAGTSAGVWCFPVPHPDCSTGRRV